MIVRVNGEVLSDLPPGQQEALQELAAALRRNQLVVRSLRVDGTPAQVSLEELASSPGSIQELDLEVSTVDALLEEVRSTAADYLPRLAEQLSRCATHLQQGQEAEALSGLLKAMDGLEWYAEVTGSLSRLLGDAAGPLPDVVAQYREIVAALQNRDYVLLADLLAYDLVPGIHSWLGVLGGSPEPVQP